METIAYLALQALNGLQHGLVLYVVASGLTLIFGVMRIVNLAHGALYMIGAYLAWSLTAWCGSFWLGAILSIPVLLALGFFIERFVVARLDRTGPLQQLLGTFALILILDEARAILWGNEFHSVAVPTAFAFSIPLTDQMAYPAYRVVLGLSCLVLALALYGILSHTRLGRQVRAIASNREMSEALGVDARSVFATVFVGGTLLAGLAGFLSAPVSAVYPGMSDQVLITSFVIVVIGGLGSLRGALWAALVVGEIDTFARLAAPGLAGVLTFALMAAVLAWRPNGLFGATETQ